MLPTIRFMVESGVPGGADRRAAREVGRTRRTAGEVAGVGVVQATVLLATPHGHHRSPWGSKLLPAVTPTTRAPAHTTRKGMSSPPETPAPGTVEDGVAGTTRAGRAICSRSRST